MRRNLFVVIAMACVCLVSCAENKVRDTAEDFLKNRLKNPESFQMESIEIRKDTIPYYLSAELLDIAGDFREAVDDYDRYKNRGRLWREEASDAQSALMTNMFLMTSYRDSLATKENTNLEYVVCTRISGTNPMGGRVSNKYILIVDADNPTKVMGSFVIDDDFIKAYMSIKMVIEQYEFETNQFGEFVTDELQYIEQFIMNN